VRRAWWILVASCGLGACGSDTAAISDEEPDPPPPAPEGCSAGERPLEDGSCLPAGVTTCGEGFAPSGTTSCEAILPASPCPVGQIAVPGDSACRDIMDCGAGTWGDIPGEAGTIYVDAAASGGGDGSNATPFDTLSAGLGAVPTGGMVALAAGTYSGLSTNKAVRLWARCPTMVTLDGGGVEGVAVSGASGVEVHGAAITSSQAGVVVFGGELLLDRVHVRDTGEAGLRLFDDAGPARVEVRDSLIEATTRYGIWMAGSELVLDRSLIRGVKLGSFPFAQALAIQPSLDGVRSTASMTTSVIEANEDVGFALFGSDATVDASVLRGTLPRASDGAHGRGLVAQDAPMTGPAALTLRTSMIQDNHEVGIFVAGSAATIEQTVVRRTLAGLQSGEGRGVDIEASYLDGQPSVVTLSGCSVEQSVGVGVVVLGADAVFDGMAVFDVASRPADGWYGHGIGIQDSFESGTTSNVELWYGRVSNAREVGIGVTNAGATIVGQLVENVAPSAREYGDAFAVTSRGAPASVTISDSEARAAGRAGLAVFGATASLDGSTVSCSAIDIVVSAHEGGEPTLIDGGGNSCGCEVYAECKALSPELAPPDPLDPLGE
jgi:hypothetical protein